MDDLLTDQEPAVDPLALAVGGDPAAAADPAGFIDEAVADGTAAPEDSNELIQLDIRFDQLDCDKALAS